MNAYGLISYSATDVIFTKFEIFNKIVREEDSSFNINVNILNFQGWSITEKILPTTNFDFNAYTTDSLNASLQFWSKNVALKAISNLNKELNAWDSVNASKRGEASFSIPTSFKFPIRQCYNQTFICVNVSRSSTTDFLEWNDKNNKICTDLMPFVECKPNIDISISRIMLTSNQPIYRGIEQNHTFTISLSNDNSNQHKMIELFGEYFNYDIEYVISNKTLGNNNLDSTWKESYLSLKDKQRGIEIGQTIDISIGSVTTDLTREQCENDLFVCFRIKISNSSSYKDSNKTNDILCFDLQSVKNCTPAVKIETNLTLPQQTIIRGYKQSLIANVKWVNKDERFIIDDLPTGRYNFNVSLYFSSVNGNTENVIPKIYDLINWTTIANNQSINNKLEYEFSNSLRVSRNACKDYKYLCTDIVPASMSSYSLFSGDSHISCIDTKDFLNCDGLKIKNLQLQIKTNSLIENSQSQFQVFWTEGTDVNFNISFTDSQTKTWNWLKRGHTESFRIINPQIFNFTYTEYGLYNVSVNAWNDAGIRYVWIEKLVEPILENHIKVSSLYTPNEPPVSIRLYINYKYPTNIETNEILLTCSIDTGHNSTETKTGTIRHLKQLNFGYTYTMNTDEAVSRIVCNNSVSTVKSEKLFILQQNVSGLSVEFKNRFWPSFKSILLKITLENGSDVQYDVSFSDGMEKIVNNPNLFANVEPFYINHSFTKSGNFKAQVTARNKYFNITSETIQSVYIQHEVQNLTFHTDRLSLRKYQLNIRETKNVYLPTNVTCSIQFGDDTEQSFLNVSLFEGLLVEHVYGRSFNEKNKRNLTLATFCFNQVSQSNMTTAVSLEEEVKQLQITSSADFLLSFDWFIMKFFIDSGTNMNVTIFIEDEKMQFFTPGPGFFYVKNHTFVDEGIYKISLESENIVNKEKVSYKQGIAVQNRIQNASFSFQYFEPRNISIYIRQYIPAVKPTNASCVAEFENISSTNDWHLITPNNLISNNRYVNVNLLEGLTISYKYSRQFNSRQLRNQTLKVLCLNGVSNASFSQKVSLEEEISNFNVFLSQDIISTNAMIICNVNASTGTNANLTVDHGNGSVLVSLLNGPGIEFSETIIYTKPGLYHLKFEIKNSVNQFTIYKQITVQNRIENATFSLIYTEPRNISIFARQNFPLILPTNVTCSVKINNGTRIRYENQNLLIGSSYNFNLDNKYNRKEYKIVNFTIRCENLVSTSQFNKTVTLREVIDGVNLHTSVSVLKSNDSINVTLSSISGDNITLKLNFGDGKFIDEVTNDLYNDRKYQYKYNKEGNYTISVTLQNSVNKLQTSIPLPIVVQMPLIDLLIDAPFFGTLDNQPIGIKVKVNKDYSPPSEVFCSYGFVGKRQMSILNYIPDLSTTKKEFSLKYNFKRDDLGGNLDFNVTCRNLVSSITNNHNITMYEKIAGFEIRPIKNGFEKLEDVPIELIVTSGSNVSYSIQYLTNIIHFEHPNILASSEPIKRNINFNDVGNYSVKLVAKNYVSENEKSIMVIVQNRITDIDVKANNSILWTPGVITYELYTKSNQDILTDIFCRLEFSNGKSGSEFIKNWPPSSSVAFNYYFPRSAIGNLTSKIACSNLLTVSKFERKTEIILDSVIIKSVSDNGTVLLTNDTTIITEIGRMGTNSCFIFDLGDKTATNLAFGVNEFCENYALSNFIIFEKIPYEQEMIVFRHEYDEIGYYKVKVKGFNHITEDKKEMTTRVADWYCYSPNASVPVEYTFVERPKKIRKSLSFEIPVNVSWDCMKTNKIVYRWRIYRINSNIMLFESANKTLNIQKRQFDYGIYKIEYFIQMLNIIDANNTYKYFFEIVTSPLYLEFINGNSTTSLYDANKTFNAEFLSYDPDNIPNEKLKGITFSWFCRQLNEKLSSNDNTDKNFNIQNIPKLEEFKKRGGCFGHGPGFIANNGKGKLTLNTYYMLPNESYVLTVKMTSDIGKREAIAEQIMIIEKPSKPQLKIR